MNCPNCGRAAWRDSADVGVGVIYGPWGCPCGWSESAGYNQLDHANRVTPTGYLKDQWGGATPATAADGWCEGIWIFEPGPDGRYVAAPCGSTSSHKGHWLDGRDWIPEQGTTDNETSSSGVDHA